MALRGMRRSITARAERLVGQVKELDWRGKHLRSAVWRLVALAVRAS
jgi:hypothetical protein